MAVENWLEELDIGEVSLVYDPMNPHSLISIMKSRQPGDEVDDDDLDRSAPFARITAVVKEAHARRLSHGVLREVFDNFGALRDNFDATFSDSSLTDVQKAKKIAANLDEFRESLDKLAPDAVIAKSVVECMASITKGDDPAVILKELSMNAEQLSDALATAEAANEKLTAQVAELTKGKATVEAELATLKGEVAILKSKDPNASDEVKYAGMTPVAIEKMKAMEADTALLRAAVAKSEDEAGIRVKADLLKGHKVPKYDVVSAALYRVSKGKPLAARTEQVDGKDVTIPSDAEVIEQALIAKASAAAAPLKVVGATGVSKSQDEGDDGDAGVELKAKAADIAKGKGISVDAAMVEAMDANPDLYQRYKAQQRRAANAV